MDIRTDTSQQTSYLQKKSAITGKASSYAQSSLFGRQNNSSDSGYILSLLTMLQSLIDKLKGQGGNGGGTQGGGSSTIRGASRADTLQGGNSNDVIKGFGGNDILHGSGGNDRLEGGRGDDELNGDDGDDLFIDDHGSNTFSGGSGNDTVRFSGSLSDYQVALYNIDSSDKNFRISNNKTGEIQTLLNIENYQFKDQTLTAEQLRSTVEPPALKLGNEQLQAIRDHFGIANNLGISVLDGDRDKTLSSGDTLVISGGITGGEISRQILSDADIAGINGTGNEDSRAEFEANKQKWLDSGIKDYSFTLQRSCFCTPDVTQPVDLQIENGKVTDAVYSATGEPLSDIAQSNRLTIDQLFGSIENALDSNAEMVNVTYDKDYGFPTSIYIDQDSRIADEEVGFSVTNFQRDDLVFTTLAVGEEDGGFNPEPIEPPIFTTQALGEEDGGDINPLPPIHEPPVLTTQALGEEDGGGKPAPIGPPIATTLALGEEDGGGYEIPVKPTEPPVVTTKALGEEDDGGDFLKPKPIKDLPIFTTQALGEEDNGTGH